MVNKFFIWFTIVIILKQLIWVAFIPPWQFPDEQAHFAQVQNFAERKSALDFNGPNTSREIFESEKLLGTNRDGFGNNKFTYHPEFKLPMSKIEADLIEIEIRNFPVSYRTDRLIYEATVYPPMYYILGAFVYNSVYRSDLLTRIFVVRLVNIPLLLFTLFIVYKCGVILFKKNQFLTLTLLVLVGFHPMFSFVGAGITSDNLYNFLGTLVLYLCLKLITQGFNLHWLMSLIITSILLLWTKPQGKLMLLILGLGLFFQAIKVKRFPKSHVLIIILIFLFALGYMFLNLLTGKQFLPEIPVWDTFLHKELSLMSHLKWTLIHTYREIMPWYWGVFRWLSLTYPRIIHRTINWTVLSGILGLLIYFVKRKYHITKLKLALFLISANLLYFSGLFVFDFFFTRSFGYSFGVQGRYYFPLIQAQMGLLVVGISSLTYKHWPLLITGLGIISLHFYAQWFLIESYLPVNSLNSFFVQASFYKPYFIKSPFLEVITILYIVSLVVFLWYYVHLWRRDILPFYGRK